MNEHLFKRFDEELTKLRYRLVKMGTLVQQQVEMAIRALTEDNPEFAKIVIETEEKVNKLDLKIDKQCLRIFALHQPVAMDLRLVLSAVSINDNMEIIGDFATDIAESYKQMNLPIGLVNKTKFHEMDKTVREIIANILDSFVYMNIELSIESIKKDSEINKLYLQNFNILVDMMKNDTTLIEPCCYLIDINRNIRSLAGQARTIAEELIFLVEAKMIKHKNLYNPEDELPEDDSSETEN